MGFLIKNWIVFIGRKVFILSRQCTQHPANPLARHTPTTLLHLPLADNEAMNINSKRQD